MLYDRDHARIALGRDLMGLLFAARMTSASSSRALRFQRRVEKFLSYLCQTSLPSEGSESLEHDVCFTRQASYCLILRAETQVRCRVEERRVVVHSCHS